MLPRLIVLFLQRQFTVSKFRSRLSFWKERMLSIGGRICLIKSVQNSIPFTICQLSWCLKGLPNCLLLLKESFYGPEFQSNERYRGGQGIGSLMGKNKARLFKWLWRLSTESTDKLKGLFIYKKHQFPFFWKWHSVLLQSFI